MLRIFVVDVAIKLIMVNVFILSVVKLIVATLDNKPISRWQNSS
jgi:hypothetical protein